MQKVRMGDKVRLQEGGEEYTALVIMTERMENCYDNSDEEEAQSLYEEDYTAFEGEQVLLHFTGENCPGYAWSDLSDARVCFIEEHLRGKQINPDGYFYWAYVEDLVPDSNFPPFRKRKAKETRNTYMLLQKIYELDCAFKEKQHAKLQNLSVQNGQSVCQEAVHCPF